MEDRVVAILGVGGHGRSLGEFLLERGDRITYLDDDPKGHPVTGPSDLLKDEKFLRDHRIVIGIGDNKIRHHFSMVVLKSGGVLKNVRHRSSVTANTCLLGMGFQLFPLSIVGTSVKIENFVIINNKASVGHDSIIRDGAQVADGATLAGHVVVGKRTLIGCGATILPRVKIGDDCIVGAGAIVTKDVPSGSVVKGNPAR